MWSTSFAFLMLTAPSADGTPTAAQGADRPCTGEGPWTLVAHGGAGAWDKKPRAEQNRARAALRSALEGGSEMLKSGAEAVDVVEAVIVALEDDPVLNAGRGGIPNKEGFVELDAAIMRGQDQNVGAVASLRRVKNPIRLARAVMERSRHVMFAGPGAEDFASANDIELVDPDYFLTTDAGSKPKGEESGTVGAVVLDRCGHVAAGTSTGGYDAKTPGRVGDVPVIGAGTYASDTTAAISATGWGEWFIRYTAAHDVAALIAYRNMTLEEAVVHVLERKLKPRGGLGGFIAVRPSGEFATHFTTAGMLRGHITKDGPLRVDIF